MIKAQEQFAKHSIVEMRRIYDDHVMILRDPVQLHSCRVMLLRPWLRRFTTILSLLGGFEQATN